jgi:hypothetical protein
MREEALHTELMQNSTNGSLLHPFCHLMILAVRMDSPPCGFDQELLGKSLSEARLRGGQELPEILY